jgi:hypothetical protein
MFSFLKNERIIKAVMKIKEMPQPQCPETKRYMLKKVATTARIIRMIKALMI